MASENPASDGPAETPPPMDYDEHNKTYDLFIALTKLGIVVCLNVLLILVLVGAIKGGTMLGIVLLIATLIGAGIDIAMRGGWTASLVVFGLGIVFVLFSLM